MLEDCLKHLFEYSRFHLRLIHRPLAQLQPTRIKAVYGHDFDSHELSQSIFSQQRLYAIQTILQISTANNMF